MLAIGILLALLVHLGFVAVRCYFRIDEGHVGVLTRFGAALREPGDDRRLRLYRPGLHLKWPWYEVHLVPLMEQIIELSGRERGRSVMMEDGTVLRVDSILRFLPVESEIYRFLFDLKEPKKHIAELFTCLLRNELANARGKSADDEGGSLAHVRSERSRVNAEIMTFCQREIGDVYGVNFGAVDLVDIRPPDELDEALNAVTSARTDAEAIYARTDADCQRRVIAAERGVEVARVKAEAVEREIAGLARALAALEQQGTLDLYVERRRAEVLSQSKLHYVRALARPALAGARDGGDITSAAAHGRAPNAGRAA